MKRYFFQDLIEIYRNKLTALHELDVAFCTFKILFCRNLRIHGTYHGGGEQYASDILFDKYIWYARALVAHPQ